MCRCDSRSPRCGENHERDRAARSAVGCAIRLAARVRLDGAGRCRAAGRGRRSPAGHAPRSNPARAAASPGAT
ncbi:hypothetical protein C2U34_20400, partial [Ralstonia solanacearum]